jgi:hypothetical protein
MNTHNAHLHETLDQNMEIIRGQAAKILTLNAETEAQSLEQAKLVEEKTEWMATEAKREEWERQREEAEKQMEEHRQREIRRTEVMQQQSAEIESLQLLTIELSKHLELMKGRVEVMEKKAHREQTSQIPIGSHSSDQVALSLTFDHPSPSNPNLPTNTSKPSSHSRTNFTPPQHDVEPRQSQRFVDRWMIRDASKRRRKEKLTMLCTESPDNSSTHAPPSSNLSLNASLPLNLTTNSSLPDPSPNSSNLSKEASELVQIIKPVISEVVKDAITQMTTGPPQHLKQYRTRRFKEPQQTFLDLEKQNEQKEERDLVLVRNFCLLSD